LSIAAVLATLALGACGQSPTSPSDDLVQQDQSPVHMDQIGASAPSLQSVSTTPTPGDFSPYVAKSNYTVDNCLVEVGWLYDTQLAPNWRHWGGVRVNCATRHSWIDATVALFYWNGSRWVQYGVSNYGIRYNQFGSGTGLDGILRTSQYCVSGLRQYYWIVSTTVRTERTGATVWTTPVQNTREGC
jgi:hypothetical protein